MLTRSVMIVLATALAVSGQTPRPSTENIPAKTRQARALLNQAKALALTIKDEFQRDEIVDEIGTAQAKAGDLEGAIDTANRADIPPTRTLEAIGEQLAKSNDLSKARSLGSRLKDGKPYSLLPDMARAQAKAKQFTEALRTAEEIQFLELRRYALEDIATFQAASGDYVAARKTFALARIAHPTGLVTNEEIQLITEAADLITGEVSPEQFQISSKKPAHERFAMMLGMAEVLRQKGEKSRATSWLDNALQNLSAGPDSEFFRYFAIPTQVKLGQTEAAMQAADKLSGEMRGEGFMAVGVTCAEMKDLSCADDALRKLQSAGTKQEGKSYDFSLKHMMLSVTAALIDNDLSAAAMPWLGVIEGTSYKLGVAPRAMKQRALVLAKQHRHAEALQLALKMEPDSMTDTKRGTALRMIALLQTKRSGSRPARFWILKLRRPEERAFALLGVAQALLGMEETKLGYSAIQFH